MKNLKLSGPESVAKILNGVLEGVAHFNLQGYSCTMQHPEYFIDVMNVFFNSFRVDDNVADVYIIHIFHLN